MTSLHRLCDSYPSTKQQNGRERTGLASARSLRLKKTRHYEGREDEDDAEEI